MQWASQRVLLNLFVWMLLATLRVGGGGLSGGFEEIWTCEIGKMEGEGRAGMLAWMGGWQKKEKIKKRD